MTHHTDDWPTIEVDTETVASMRPLGAVARTPQGDDYLTPLGERILREALARMERGA